MKVLLSIKPEFVEKIFSGEKKFEYRKNIFKNKNVNSVIIYSTMPVGKIVGEFSFSKIHKKSAKELWEETKQSSGVSKEFFFEYFKNKSECYAIEIEKIQKYDTPINPHIMFPNFTAPQSFCYVDSKYTD